MADTKFVMQSGMKENDQEKRKFIRRHVMLGKNQRRTPAPKPPTLDGCAVFRMNDSGRAVQPYQATIPRRMGSDLELAEFADAVEPSLMNETLQFFSSTNQKLFRLEPCISFDSTDVSAICLQSLTNDALHLNAMVFGTQAYMNQVFWQSTSRPRAGVHNAILRHHGHALRLLRERLADAEKQQSKISDITITSVITLAMHALVNGETESARNHVVGLSRLMGMRKSGLYSFWSQTKQMIEILRCDISVSLATGQAPVFFSDPLREPIFPLPELPSLDKMLGRRPTIVNGELAKMWDVLSQFCAMINKAALSKKKVADRVLLEIVASVMYRLLNMSLTPSSYDEAIRLGMISFCASALLPWGQLRVPFTWLQFKYKLAITSLMRSDQALSDAEAVLWCLATYAAAFSPLLANESNEVKLMLTQVIDLCGLTDWDGVKEVVGGYLWIDLVYYHSARQLFEETFNR